MHRPAVCDRLDDFILNSTALSVEKSGLSLALEPKSIRLLLYLIQNRYQLGCGFRLSGCVQRLGDGREDDQPRGNGESFDHIRRLYFAISNANSTFPGSPPVLA